MILYRFWIGVVLLIAGLLCQSVGVGADPLSSGMINGRVFDEEDQLPIPGAVVKIEFAGDISGATTGKDGEYIFKNLTPGLHAIEVEMIGYNAFRREVVLKAGTDYVLDIALAVNPIRLLPVDIIAESPRVYKKLTGAVAKLEPQAVELIRPVGTQELLELVPGINGYADDGFGNSRLSIGIRGLNPRRSSRVLVLEDGVPIQPAVYIYPNMYYNPPAERIDALEVIKGSAAVRYGPQTMGGIVNYTTRRPGQTEGTVYQVTLGNNGYYSLFLERSGMGSRRAKSDVQVLYKHGDGFRDNNTFDQVNSTLKTHFLLSDKKVLYLKVNGNFENTNATYTGLTEYTFANFPNFNPKDEDNFKVWRGALDLIYTNKIATKLTGTTTVYASVFDRRWWREDDIFVRSGALETGDLTAVPYFQTGDIVRVGGGQSNFGILRTFYVGGIEQNYTLKHRWMGRRGRLELGVRGHWERFIDDKKVGSGPNARDGVYFTGTPDDLDDPVQIVGQSHHYETAALALYAREQLAWERWTVSPGLRFEVFKQDRVDRLRGSAMVDKLSHVLLPGVGVNYQFERFNLFGGVHRGYTPPSSGTLKITNFGQNVVSGGLDLKPEKSWNIELGARSWGTKASLEITGFLLRIDHLVAAGRGTAFKNLGRVDTYGIEAGAALRTSRYAALLPDVNFSYTYLQTEIKSGVVSSAVIAGNVDVDLAGNELPYAPEHTLTLGLAKQVNAKLRLRADWRYVGQVFTDFENIEETFNRGDTGPVPSYSILNASMDYKVSRQWSAFLSAKNLLDEVYIGSRLHSNAGQPQANLSSGILIGPRRQINLGVKRGI